MYKIPRNLSILKKKHTVPTTWQRYYAVDSKSGKKDLYSILGVHSKASQSEIKKAYYSLTFQYHPDRNEGCPEAATRFREVTEAYEILGNIPTRSRYDQGISYPVIDIHIQKKTPIEKPVPWQQFYDRRNRPDVKTRTTLGDTTSETLSRPRLNASVGDEPEETVKEKHNFEKLKLALIAIIIFILAYRQKPQS